MKHIKMICKSLQGFLVWFLLLQSFCSSWALQNLVCILHSWVTDFADGNGMVIYCNQTPTILSVLMQWTEFQNGRNTRRRSKYPKQMFNIMYWIFPILLILEWGKWVMILCHSKPASEPLHSFLISFTFLISLLFFPEFKCKIINID